MKKILTNSSMCKSDDNSITVLYRCNMAVKLGKFFFNMMKKVKTTCVLEKKCNKYPRQGEEQMKQMKRS